MSVKIIKNGSEWTVREGYECIPDRLNPDEIFTGLNDERFRLVKENRVRMVISMLGPGISENGIYIKYFKRGGFRNYVKYLFVPNRARTEWEVGNALLRKNINTAIPLAISERKRCLILVTEAVTDSQELMEFCHANYEGGLTGGKESEKKRLLCRLAGFLKGIHEGGVCHYDLHAGNILIKFLNNQSSPAGDFSLYLMDLHCVKIGRSISVSKRILNLAQIFNSLSSIMTQADKFDFIRSYGTDALIGIKNEYAQPQTDAHPISSPLEWGKKEFNRIPSGIAQLIRQIESQSSRMRDIHYRSRLKRCLKESTVFSKKRVAGLKMFFRKGYDTGSFQKLILRHNSALTNNEESVIIKRDLKTALTRLPFNEKSIRTVVVKQYKARCCATRIFKNIFRRPAGRRAWVAGNGLRVYGFITPLPLALIEKKIFGITADSYLIMEEVKDCLEMDRYILKNLFSALPDAERSCKSTLKKRRLLIYNLAETIGKMHNHNIFHHDLKTCNIMVKESGERLEFIFLDFDKVSFREEITLQRRVENMIQVNLSTPKLITTMDRLRFLKKYLKQCGLIKEERNMLRKIVNLSRKERILYVSFNGDVTEDW